MGTPGLYCAIPSIVLIVTYPNKLYIDYVRSIKLNLKLGIWSSGMLHKCWLIVNWWLFRTAYQSVLQGHGAGCLTLKTRLICCPKMSVSNYQSMLCNFPEQQRTHLHCSRSLKSHVKLKSLYDLLCKSVALATSSAMGNKQQSVKWKHRKTNVHKFLTPHKILKQQLLNQPPNLKLFCYM